MSPHAGRLSPHPKAIGNLGKTYWIATDSL